MAKPNIYIVDDNDGFRQSVAFMLDAAEYSIKQFDCAEAVLESLNQDDSSLPVCMLLDVRMPGLSGMDLHDKINTSLPEIPVIYMTGHADVPLAVEAMKKGAVTLLEKPLNAQALKHAVSSAVLASSSRSTPKNPGMEAILAAGVDDSKALEADAERQQFDEKLALLTPREGDVLEQLLKGLANKQCAYELEISIRTVELHKSNLMKKLCVRSSSELMRAVLLHRTS